MTTVMVTGVGAIIGYGILRSFHKSNQPVRLVGTDIFADAVGQKWADHFVVAPLTSSDNYQAWLEKTIIEYSIKLVIPGIEQDLYFFSDHRDIFDKLSVKVVLNNQHLIDLSRDKWLMHQELALINSEVRIPSYLEGGFDTLAKRLKLPFLLKPRRGYASKGIIFVRSKADFDPVANNIGSDLMAQPIIGSDDEEYTISIFGDGTGHVCSSITLQRKLSGEGATAKAWVKQFDDLDEVIRILCAHFKPIGPTNLQFRKDDKGWKLLEINPRISSATSLRTAFGYNEAEMCLRFFLEEQKLSQPVIKPGFAVRFIEDHIVHDSVNF